MTPDRVGGHWPHGVMAVAEEVALWVRYIQAVVIVYGLWVEQLHGQGWLECLDAGGGVVQLDVIDGCELFTLAHEGR